MTQVRADGQPMDRPEEQWQEVSVDELAALRRFALESTGISQATANGLIGWLVGLPAGQDATKAKATVASYRKVLREYGPPKHGRPARRRGRGRKLAIAAMAVVSAGGAAGLANRAAQSPQEARNIAASVGGADKTRSCRDEESDGAGELAEAA